MQFRKEEGFLKVIFEGDAAQVVKEIHSEPHFLSRIGHFIESIHQEIGSFRLVSFVAIPRACNSAIHTLTNEASQNNINICWLEETPQSVSTIVIREQLSP
jgi:hypothetical protein